MTENNPPNTIHTDLMVRARELLEGITPGPWKIVTNRYGEQVLVEEPTDGTLFLLDDDEGIADFPTAEANAKLIASSPTIILEMVEEIERLRQLVLTLDPAFAAGAVEPASRLAPTGINRGER